MSYTREQIEDCARDLKEESANAENALFGSNDKAALMLRQLLAENDALREDAERLLYMSQDMDGFVHVGRDKYEYAIECMQEAGRSEPTADDELNGLRRMIDAARKKW